MSKLKFLHRWLHEALGLHDFGLVGDARSGYRARCSCGVFIRRWKP